MSCNGCGTPTGLSKDQVENLVNKLVNDGVLSGGLKDCAGNTITTGSKVVVCDALTLLINEKIKAGDIDVVKDVTLKSGNITVTKGNGTLVEFPIPAIASLSINAENKLVATKLNGENAELQLPGLHSAGIFDGKLRVETLSGNSTEFAIPGLRSISGGGTQIVAVDFLGQETTIDLQDLVGVEGLSFADHKLKYTVNNAEHEIELPYAHSFRFDETTRTLSWIEGNTPFSARIPYTAVSIGDTEVVLTDANGQSVAVRKNEFTLKEKEDFDITLKRGANFEGRIGVNLKENGGIDHDKNGGLFIKVGKGLAVDPNGDLYVKIGLGFKLDDNGNLSVDTDALLAPLLDKFDGDGLVWRDGRLHVAAEDLVDAIGEKIGNLVNKEA